MAANPNVLKHPDRLPRSTEVITGRAAGNSNSHSKTMFMPTNPTVEPVSSDKIFDVLWSNGIITSAEQLFLLDREYVFLKHDAYLDVMEEATAPLLPIPTNAKPNASADCDDLAWKLRTVFIDKAYEKGNKLFPFAFGIAFFLSAIPRGKKEPVAMRHAVNWFIDDKFELWWVDTWQDRQYVWKHADGNPYSDFRLLIA